MRSAHLFVTFLFLTFLVPTFAHSQQHPIVQQAPLFAEMPASLRQNTRFSMSLTKNGNESTLTVIAFEEAFKNEIFIQSISKDNDRHLQLTTHKRLAIDPTLGDKLRKLVSVIKTPEEDYLLLGRKPIRFGKPGNVVVAKVDQKGSLITTFADQGVFTNLNNDFAPKDFAIEPDGSISVTGSFNEFVSAGLAGATTNRVFYTKLDSSGNLIEQVIFRLADHSDDIAMTNGIAIVPGQENGLTLMGCLAGSTSSKVPRLTKIDSITRNNKTFKPNWLNGKPFGLSDYESGVWERIQQLNCSFESIDLNTSFGDSGFVTLNFDSVRKSDLCSGQNCLVTAGPLSSSDESENILAIANVDSASGEITNLASIQSDKLVAGGGKVEVSDLQTIHNDDSNDSKQQVALVVRVRSIPLLVSIDY